MRVEILRPSVNMKPAIEVDLETRQNRGRFDRHVLKGLRPLHRCVQLAQRTHFRGVPAGGGNVAGVHLPLDADGVLSKTEKKLRKLRVGHARSYMREHARVIAEIERVLTDIEDEFLARERAFNQLVYKRKGKYRLIIRTRGPLGGFKPVHSVYIV